MPERTYDFRGNPFQIFCTESPSHASWYSFEDEANLRDIYWTIQPGDNILDIGAAYGSYTLTALSQGANFVWSWCPQQGPGDNFSEAEYLTESLKMNSWEDKCKIYKTGIYSQKGYLHTDSQIMVDSLVDWMTIEVERLDEWAAREIPDITKLDWLKMDVEGAEVEALKSGELLIKKYWPKIFVENHIFKRATIAQEVSDYLTSLGYKEVGSHGHHGVTHTLYIKS